MKLFTVLLLILAVIGTQAKFNLRTYAQQKLRADAAANTHVIAADIATTVQGIVDRCFEAQLGKDNAELANTVAVNEFQTAEAIKGINLCLLSSNLRLGHDVDANITSSIDALKAASEDLVEAQNAYSKEVKNTGATLKTDVDTLESQIQSAREEFQSVFEQSESASPQENVDALVKYLEDHEGAFGNVHGDLKTAFDAFATAKGLAETALSQKATAVYTKKGIFDTKKDQLGNNKDQIVSQIINHYNEVDDGSTDAYPHRVSGKKGQGCGTLAYVEDGDNVESSNDKMCDGGLICVDRGSQRISALKLNTDEMANLDYSGAYVCVSKADTGLDAVSGATVTVKSDDDCQDSSRDKRGREKASCNLYDLN